ncbi:helix-turn-helix domain-containing protein [uncultured Cohaesibacter sp.]|uniref:IclR family transcriptional regulator domain-containing protein n=1 Tax=uncultured Cohaesibacter sp. TaxID=1002546 RepID=UPI00292EA871|nr:helix-turn-helix domain-containing protein [uncultured Cohaesibacter sp.]
MGIRAIERALDVLAELNQHPVSSIASLHAATRLPKPTLVRILKTLEEKGYVDNDPHLGGYLVTSQVTSLSGGYHSEPMVVEASRPWAIAMTRQHQWPISIALLDQDAIVVRFSTIPDSAISPFHMTVNMRLPILTRGLGLAFFAFSKEDERELILQSLRQSDDPEAVLSRDKDRLAAMIEQVREQGYATRSERAKPTNSNTIAVPIFAGDGRVVASMGLTYFRSAFPNMQSAIDRYVPLLKQASREITTDIERLFKHSNFI